MRGAVVGGSGAINGGYFCRGLPADFDGWGLPGWSWADVLPHFRAIETDLDFDGPLHGSDGPMTIRRITEFDGRTRLSSKRRDDRDSRGSPISTVADRRGRPEWARCR